MEITPQNPSLVLEGSWRESVADVKKLPISLPKDLHLADRIFSLLLKGAGLSVLVLLLSIILFLGWQSLPAIQQFGASFLFTTKWNPSKEIFGALPVIYGTVVSSLLALAISAPLSIGVALYLNELSDQRMARIAGFLVEMLAAIPSVVYGLWGIFILAPFLRETVEPFLGKYFGFIPLFQGTPFGVGMLAAGIVLAIMITPTITSICREVFKAIPNSYREAAYALGATRWEMMRMSVLATARTGMMGGIILGLGRALGETMAVTMVIGNRNQIAASLFAPSQTMASIIANEYAEASGGTHLAALCEIGLVLFLVTFTINAFARLIVWNMTGRFKK